MKIGAFGEVMLRLSPPEQLLLEQTDTLRMMFTGTGVNILANLSAFGLETSMLSAVPDNRLGHTALAHLRKLGLGTSAIKQYGNHIGSYFAEMGFGVRPTMVTYQNRIESSFCRMPSEDFELDQYLETIDLVHICGIALSLTDTTVLSALELAKKANQKGVKVCFDFNFRPSLNTQADKKSLMKARYQEILPYCDIVFGSPRDLTELLGMKEEQETQLIQNFLKTYGIEWFAGTKRSGSDDKRTQIGYLFTKEQAVSSNEWQVQILDRIGTGDAYAAGVLLGYAEKWDLQETVEFAITNAVLAHTTYGDVPMTTRSQVQQVMENPMIDILR